MAFENVLKPYHTTEQWLRWIDELSEQNYVLIDDFLNAEDYLNIRNFFINHLDDFSPAGIGALGQNQVVKSIRGDVTYWLDSKRDEQLQNFWQLVEESLSTLNRYCYLSLSGFEFHLAHYAPGQGYDRHIDQFDQRSNRMISIVIYLNENWQPGDGGELQLIDAHGKAKVIAPLRNRLMMFKSADVPHEVLPANTSRYSLTGWLLYRPAVLGSIFKE